MHVVLQLVVDTEGCCFVTAIEAKIAYQVGDYDGERNEAAANCVEYHRRIREWIVVANVKHGPVVYNRLVND